MKKLLTKVHVVLFVASCMMMQAYAAVTSVTQAQDVIRMNVGIILQNKGKAKEAMTNRSAANKEIGHAMAFLKKDKTLTATVNTLDASIKELNGMVVNPTANTTAIEKRIGDNLAALAHKEVAQIEKKAKARKDKIAKLIEEDQRESEKEAVEAQGLLATNWERAKSTASSVSEWFTTKTPAKYLFAGYHSTPEEKEVARKTLGKLLAERADLEDALTVTTDKQEIAQLNDDIADLNAQIREQKIILGTAWTGARKAAWGTIGATGAYYGGKYALGTERGQAAQKYIAETKAGKWVGERAESLKTKAAEYVPERVKTGYSKISARAEELYGAGAATMSSAAQKIKGIKTQLHGYIGFWPISLMTQNQIQKEYDEIKSIPQSEIDSWSEAIHQAYLARSNALAKAGAKSKK